jgi:hypothetical protein
MSPREKKLLIFFATAGFIVVNFLAYAWFDGASARVRSEREEAKLGVERAEMLRASSELVAAQMDWLAEHQPDPIAPQDAQSSLQQFVEQQARASGLTIRNQRPLQVDDSGTHYHRARLQIEVTGREQALYQWFNLIKAPEEFRATTRILMNPNRENDTLIDCRADIEQWFLPATPDA